MNDYIFRELIHRSYFRDIYGITKKSTGENFAIKITNKQIFENHPAIKDILDRKTVTVRNLRNGKEYEEAYDILLLSPGAEPIIPPVPGTDLPGIFTLRNVSDCDRIKAAAAQSLCDGAEAVIIGGGFIGLEMAENLPK